MKMEPKHNGFANDRADYRPPSMHVGDDGAKMETWVGERWANSEVIQIAFYRDALTERELTGPAAFMRGFGLTTENETDAN